MTDLSRLSGRTKILAERSEEPLQPGDVEPNRVKDRPIRLDGSRWWHYPYVIPVVDGTPGPERKICAPYDGVHLFKLWRALDR